MSGMHGPTRCRPLRRVPRGAGRAGRRLLHSGRAERRV